jgi:hypothetical protein
VPPPPGDEEKTKSDQPVEIPLWAIVAAGVVALALVVVAAVMVLRPPGRDEGPVGPLPTSKPSYPATWNPKIKPIADKAAVMRSLNFDHPVPVRFLTSKKFDKTLTGEGEEFTREDRAQLEHQTALLRALGLVTGDLDLAEAASSGSSGGVLAYYDFEDERITVRGKKITPAVRVTLVHELTHVLDDQNFQVGDRLDKLEKQAEKGPDTPAAAVLRAMVEGDARRVESDYRGSLREADRRVLARYEHRQFVEAQERVGDDVPPLLVTQASAPYVLGEGLMQTLATNGGNDSVDRLFRKPPVHDSILLDPYRVIRRDTGATKVAVPSLAAGEKEFVSGELGVLTWYFMLAERLPLGQALTAADGWGGDAYVAFDRGDTTCAKLAFAGRTKEATSRMRSALDQWAAAAPGEQTVTSAGGLVRVASCDPGTGVSGAADTSQAALGLLATRAAALVAIAKQGATLEAASCVVSKLLATFSVDQLNDPEYVQLPSVQAELYQIGVSCR